MFQVGHLQYAQATEFSQYLQATESCHRQLSQKALFTQQPVNILKGKSDCVFSTQYFQRSFSLLHRAQLSSAIKPC